MYVWFIALYGAEIWILNKKNRDKSHTFEVWTWRKMERIGWAEKKSYVQVLHQNKDR